MESFTVLDVVYMYKVVHGEYFLPLAAQVWAQYLLARYRPLSTSLFRSYLRSKEILGNLAVKRVVHNSGIDVCNLLIKPARTKLLVWYNIAQLSQVNFVEGNRHENLLFCYKTMFFHNAIILLLSFYDEQPWNSSKKLELFLKLICWKKQMRLRICSDFLQALICKVEYLLNVLFSFLWSDIVAHNLLLLSYTTCLFKKELPV